MVSQYSLVLRARDAWRVWAMKVRKGGKHQQQTASKKREKTMVNERPAPASSTRHIIPLLSVHHCP